MLVRDIMSKHVVTVGLDATIESVRELLASRHIHHVVALDERRVVGVVSDRDVMRSISPFTGTTSERTIDAATLKKHVHQIMSRQVLVVSPETPVPDAAKLLLEKGISCLPVVDTDASLVGIITTRDLLRAALRGGYFAGDLPRSQAA